ncbi:MAG: cupin domain-containing protein, partial [Halobacteriaceae archaeon]
MRTIAPEDLDDRMGPASVVRPLTDQLGLTNAAINYYELEPGDSFAFGYHAHEQQEEIFYIQRGRVTFRTQEGDVSVEAGELARFGPGEYQRGINEGEERVVALAIGAPKEAG